MTMANPARGEVEIVIDGRPHVMRLTLGALATLEEELGSESLVALAERFESGQIRSGELLKLLAAGLRGGGNPLSDDALRNAAFDGGAVAAMRAGIALLARTFSSEAA